MGIQDRHYYQRDDDTRRRLYFAVRTSPTLTIILVTVFVWLAQLVGRAPVTGALSASAETVFGRLQLWRLVTAVFAHSPTNLWHLAFNMIFLFWAGKELEQLYEKRDIYTLYLVAGTLSILAEVSVLAQFATQPGMEEVRGVQVLGASGAVMAFFVLFATFYPQRTIFVFGIIPAPVWLLCVIYIGSDLLGALSGQGSGVAHMAHLAGALLGWLYRIVDPRWVRILPSSRTSARQPRRVRRRRARSFEVIQFPASRATEPPRPAEATGAPKAAEPPQDGVSRMIDDLLAKISTSGKESLSQEEWEFLRDNASKYRST